MDPTALLQNIRDAVIRFWDMLNYSCDEDEIIDLSQDIVTMIDNLDNWLTTGGFLPEQWRDYGHDSVLLT